MASLKKEAYERQTLHLRSYAKDAIADPYLTLPFLNLMMLSSRDSKSGLAF